MAKSRNFSIFLLKDSITPDTALKDNHGMSQVNSNGSLLPENAVMYIVSNPHQAPWWKSYWGIEADVITASSSGITFLMVENRWFALTFGNAYHKLKENSYEYDFGLRATLNAIDPKKIKSTDILTPDIAKRQRIQMPSASTLSNFDVRTDDTIVKRLTGSVKDEYKELFKNITGTTSIHFASPIAPDEISSLCGQLYQIYQRTDFETTFPEINNIVPIKDPNLIAQLNARLLEAINNGNHALSLAVPEIIDYTFPFSIKYTGLGRSNCSYEDINLDDFYTYLSASETSINNCEVLKQCKLQLVDDNDQALQGFTIYKCILFDCRIDNHSYHLCEGGWYKVNQNFIDKISAAIDVVCFDYHPYLIDCQYKREDAYNLAVKTAYDEVVCLDKKNISPDGNTAIEPCDLIVNTDGAAELIHVKKSTRSSSLSHLFNQGINSLMLLKRNAEARTKLKCLVNDDAFAEPIDQQNFRVTFGIITSKSKEGKSSNLPLFSKISLYKCLDTMNLMSTPCKVYFIKDNATREES